ncbi:tetratricopeptide repeat protein [Microcoleus sp. D2_18a_B4]|uniref:tetratricopeptide repeat protein n=1 Tax=Microcoleus sp. D2_18a_B4 TaxID=3055329 RepID=UPI002FD4CD83
MNIIEAKRLFDEANRLWFSQGKLNKVLPLYREALKYDPSNSVIIYQLANVLWAFEEFDEVRALVAKIERNLDRLSDFGKEVFAKAKPRLLSPSPFKTPMPIPACSIDLEELNSMGLSHKQWMCISSAAKQRRMFNLAALGEERSFPFITRQSQIEKRKLKQENDNCLGYLQRMFPDAKRLFDEANRLWFGYGKFNKVLPLYREALKYDPSNPVILYQLANVLWTFEQFGEVRALVAKIEKNLDCFSDFGKEMFAEEKSRLLDPSPFKTPMPIPARSINLEELDSRGWSWEKWMDIGWPAEERRMFNLAAMAEERSCIFDGDSAREICELDQKNSDCFNYLLLMFPESKE